jgi:hypothetical protein
MQTRSDWPMWLFLPYLLLDQKVTKNQGLYFLFKAAIPPQQPKLHKSPQLL